MIEPYRMHVLAVEGEDYCLTCDGDCRLRDHVTQLRSKLAGLLLSGGHIEDVDEAIMDAFRDVLAATA